MFKCLSRCVPFLPASFFQHIHVAVGDDSKRHEENNYSSDKPEQVSISDESNTAGEEREDPHARDNPRICLDSHEAVISQRELNGYVSINTHSTQVVGRCGETLDVDKFYSVIQTTCPRIQGRD